MKTLSALPVLTLALALAACGGDKSGNATGPANSSAGAVSAPTGSSWAETASKTADGGFVIGNPNAAVKLIEYGALSCSHCAEFSEKSHDKLMGYVAKGTVSFEFRPFLLNVLDVPSSLLARCNGPLPFFTIAEQMYAAQRDWAGKAAEITPAEQQSWQSLPPEGLAPAVAAKLGLDTFVQQRGVSAEKAKACLSDKGAIDELTKIAEQGQKQFQISGTPTFVINGKAQPVNTWQDLEPLLIAAGA
jgi:protein-disulfide isomerase